MQTFPLIYKVVFADDVEERVGYVKDLYLSMEGLEKTLKGRNTKFFLGNERPGLVDYMIWPWFERLEGMTKLRPGSEFPVTQLPMLVS